MKSPSFSYYVHCVHCTVFNCYISGPASWKQWSVVQKARSRHYYVLYLLQAFSFVGCIKKQLERIKVRSYCLPKLAVRQIDVSFFVKKGGNSRIRDASDWELWSFGIIVMFRFNRFYQTAIERQLTEIWMRLSIGNPSQKIVKCVPIFLLSLHCLIFMIN